MLASALILPWRKDGKSGARWILSMIPSSGD